ncbi:MAG: hypothetical protein OXH32_03660 [Acidobacteria bacterium]|nr:hypothetical protein [Acidobacteriota bacterium]
MKLKSYFAFAARNWMLATTFVLTLVFVLGVFPFLPVGGELLDYKPSYSHEEAMAAMEEYGNRGRRVYAWASPTLDTLFPLVYVSFFAGLIYRCRPTERFWWLAFAPVAAGIVDLAENAQITLMLIQYPDVSPGQAAAASAFTQLKALVGPVYQFMALALLVLASGRWLVRRSRRSSPGDT